MGLFDDTLFDTNVDGNVDEFESYVETQMTAGSRQEAIDLTGDDTFYSDSDDLDEEDDDWDDDDDF